MRVLIVKTSSMGDVIHTLPALTDAAKNNPNIIFDWVVEEGFSQIPSWHPNVGTVIPVAIRRWRKRLFSQQTRKEWQTFKQAVTQHNYDLVIDAQGLVKSAFLTRYCQSPVHGYDKSSVREPFASLFYQHKHSVSTQLHAVERIRQLFALAIGYSIPNDKGDYAIANRFLTDEKRANYLVFLHATTRDSKHWPETHWREVIAKVKEHGIEVRLPWGAPHERERAERLATGFDHVTVLPKLTLEQVAIELANAKAVISVDTGLSHLAASLDKPNITLYGPTDPGLIGGYGQQQHYLCASDSNSNDINVITADKVMTKLEAMIKS
ncbi:lipopolysaccharide heptosyltransferase RfaC [Vibrio intestinalis]|uniref:lipopolysaccharide heptosyltransferase RfaC n=1 Tax=Vibrio intestinalis TaxID=2933291 RepID=UPI0021A57842